MMRTLIGLLLFSLVSSLAAFVPAMEWSEKCVHADVVVRGVVVEVVLVTKELDKDGFEVGKKQVGEDFSGPHAVAILKVVSAIKGDLEKMGGVLLVPCGYDFDESPAELTKGEEYVLFLDHMGSSYFEPLGPFAMHRMKGERVGLSGFDWDGDFRDGGKSEPFKEFADRVKKAIATAKKAGWKPAKE